MVPAELYQLRLDQSAARNKNTLISAYGFGAFMSPSIHSLSLPWMVVVVFILSYLAAFGIFAIVMAIAKGEGVRVLKGVSAGMLPPLGILFGLFVAFLASQVWNDLDRAKAAVNREASALSTIVYQ